MRYTAIVGALTLAMLISGCSSPESSSVSSVDWDNMDFASVHCSANTDSPACDATKNNVNTMLRSKGKK